MVFANSIIEFAFTRVSFNTVPVLVVHRADLEEGKESFAREHP